MTPESERFLAKSHNPLGEAEAMPSIGLNEAAGRSAYLAGFHAAQTFVSEETGRAVKTHKGLQTEFQRLTKVERAFAPDLRSFCRVLTISRIADYDTGPDTIVTAEQATSALTSAKRFVASIERLLEARTG